MTTYQLATKLLTGPVRRAAATGKDETARRLIRAMDAVRIGRVNARREDAGVPFEAGGRGSGTGQLAERRLIAAIQDFLAAH